MEDTSNAPREYVVKKIEKFEKEIKSEVRNVTFLLALGAIDCIMLVCNYLNIPIVKFTDDMEWLKLLMEIGLGFDVIAIISSIITQVFLNMRVDQLQTSLDLDDLSKRGR